MKRTLQLSILCSLLLVTMTGCDSGGGGEDDIPSSAMTFQATVSGAISTSLSGTALSGGPENNSGWALVLGVIPTAGKNGDGGSITFGRAEGNRPGTGTYSVNGVEESGSDIYGIAILGSTAYTATSGSFVVTSSSSTNVKGTFNFTASNGSESVTIEGGFNATNYGYFQQ